MSFLRGSTRRVSVLTAISLVLIALGVSVPQASAMPQQPSSCPGLMVYAIQGTGQSSPDANPTSDAGFLSRVLRPVMTAASGEVDRAYVPYDAGFGGAVAGGKQTYEQSVDGAVSKTESWIKDKASACPNTKFGLVGYSQGAHGVRVVLNDIVSGKTAINADELALVANFGDPGRPEGAPLFPGRPGQESPSPVPGTAGEAVSKVVASVSSAAAEGGGIAPQSDVDNKSYEAIAGRYLSSCTPGDLACDAPSSAPLAHLVTNIAGQSELNKDDPVGSLSTIATALAMTAVKTAVPVINEDIQAPDNNLQSLSFQPQQTISQRLATASDPRTPLPSVNDALSAVIKIGTIGLNAVKTVVQTVATPDTIGAIAVAGATNPLAIVGILGAKLGQAAVELFPPATQERLVSNAFDAFKGEFAANKDLFQISSLLKYWDTAKQHTSYSEVAATPTGAPPTKLVADWIIAAAKDIAGGGSGSSGSGSSDSGSTPSTSASLEDLFGGSGGASTTPTTTTSGEPDIFGTSTSTPSTSSTSSSTTSAPAGDAPSNVAPFLTGANSP